MTTLGVWLTAQFSIHYLENLRRKRQGVSGWLRRCKLAQAEAFGSRFLIFQVDSKLLSTNTYHDVLVEEPEELTSENARRDLVLDEVNVA